MPAPTSVRAAARRPSRVRNASERAVPRIVPPRWMMPPTEFHVIGRTRSAPSISPPTPSWIPKISMPRSSAVRTTALTAAFMPDASPPLVSTPTRLIATDVAPL